MQQVGAVQPLRVACNGCLLTGRLPLFPSPHSTSSAAAKAGGSGGSGASERPRVLLLLMKQGANGLNLTGETQQCRATTPFDAPRPWPLLPPPPQLSPPSPGCRRRRTCSRLAQALRLHAKCCCMLACCLAANWPHHPLFDCPAEAQHVVLAEPLLDPAVEAQAVGRVDRIGQTRATHVHRRAAPAPAWPAGA